MHDCKQYFGNAFKTKRGWLTATLFWSIYPNQSNADERFALKPSETVLKMANEAAELPLQACRKHSRTSPRNYYSFFKRVSGRASNGTLEWKTIFCVLSF